MIARTPNARSTTSVINDRRFRAGIGTALPFMVSRRQRTHKDNVLISGASFAGLATAFWWKRAGYTVTVLENAAALRKGGTPLNIKGRTIDVVKRMVLFEQMVANRIPTSVVQIWKSEGLIDGLEVQPIPDQDAETIEYEIERDVLTYLMFGLVKDDVGVVFNDSIVGLQEQADCVGAEFLSGAARTFSLIFGCDGIHSNVRSRWFGDETAFSHFVQAAGRSIILCAYHGKTDVITLLSSDRRIRYDHRDREKKLAILSNHFSGSGWRVPELLGEIHQADNLYFDELAQIKMPAWTKGRAALVGDTAYCASPAAGMCGSLAIDGAALLGDAFSVSGGDHVSAFHNYDKNFRPFVEQVQTSAADFCKDVAAGASARDIQ